MKRTSSSEGCITMPSGSCASVAVGTKSSLKLIELQQPMQKFDQKKGDQYPGKEVNRIIHPLLTKHSSADYAHNLILHP